VKKKKKLNKTVAPKDPFPIRVRQFFIGALKITVFTGGIIFSIWFGYRLHYFLFQSPFFRLKNVEIPGVPNSLKNEMILYAGLNDLSKVNHNLLKFRVGRLKKKLLQMPKLRSVDVKKDYPSTLRILAHPRKAVVLVAGKGLFLADAEGVIMEKVKPVDLKDFYLPVITGLNEQKVNPGSVIKHETFFKALDIQATLSRHCEKLYEQLSELNVSGRGNITAVLEGGTEIRFGRRDFLKRLPDLDAFLDKYSSSFRNVDQFKYVDLRFHKQIVYALRENR